MAVIPRESDQDFDHKSNRSSTDKAPFIERVDNLELNLTALEDHCSPKSVVDWSSAGSARSSCISTPSSRLKSIDDVLEETQSKGTLVERVEQLEQRLDTLSMQISKGEWTPSPTQARVPLLKSPPGTVAKHVADEPPSDMPAVEEKHEVNRLNGVSKTEEVQKGKKRHHHRLPHMLKNCIHPK